MAAYSSEVAAAIAELAAMNKSTYHPTTNPGGFAGEGYKPNVPKHANDTATVANAIAGMAGIAEDAANTAISVSINAPTTYSDSSLAIASSGTKVFHTTTDLQTTSPFKVGMWITASAATDVTKAMWGYIASLDFAADTMTVNIIGSRGSGTLANWYIIASGPPGTATGLSALVSDTSPQLGGNLDTNGNDILIAANDRIIYNATGILMEAGGGIIIEPVLQAALEKITNLGTVSNSNTLSATSALHYRLKLSGNATINPPSTLAADRLRPMLIWVTQDSTGGRTLAWGSNVKWVGGAPTMTPTANATDIYVLQGIYNGSSVVYAASIFQQGYTELGL